MRTEPMTDEPDLSTLIDLQRASLSRDTTLKQHHHEMIYQPFEIPSLPHNQQAVAEWLVFKERLWRRLAQALGFLFGIVVISNALVLTKNWHLAKKTAAARAEADTAKNLYEHQQAANHVALNDLRIARSLNNALQQQLTVAEQKLQAAKNLANERLLLSTVMVKIKTGQELEKFCAISSDDPDITKLRRTVYYLTYGVNTKITDSAIAARLNRKGRTVMLPASQCTLPTP